MATYAPTWILIADASRARLFQYDGFGTALALLKEWTHPESRAKNHDLVTDRPGRVAQSHGGPHPGHGSRSGMEPHTSPVQIEHERFARELQDELSRGLDRHACNRFILVANPEFLGMLRHVADVQVLKRIASTLDKDYTMLPIKELQRHLSTLL